MGYHAIRKREIRNSHYRQIEEFARTYKRGRPTILLLPGGMGSQIDRSGKPYKTDASSPFNQYDPIWVDLGIIFNKEALKLEIKPNYHDIDNYICIPNGPLRYVIKPYNETEEYFRNKKNFNFVVFSFDWRRPLDESAYFLKIFLQRLKSRVKELRQEDPLPTTTILCHSMGGLVAKLFLHRVFKKYTTPAGVGKWMARLVTVATPFYGTSKHMTRYYKGQKALNSIYTPKKLAQLTATFPATYNLMLLDCKTYSRYAKELEIGRYPVRDAKNPGLEADPFDPNLASRYPPWVSPDYLKLAVKTRKKITRPLPDAAADRVFHIRAHRRKTWVELRWAAVNGAQFDPDKDDSPISGKNGKGDGTVPFWSARLVQVPDSQIFNLAKAKKHFDLLEHRETLTVVSRLVERDRMPKTVKVPDQSWAGPKASKKALRKLMDAVSAGKIKRTDSMALNKRIWRRIIQEIDQS
jgi:Lecithin:cholesterol acyltransferase